VQDRGPPTAENEQLTPAASRSLDRASTPGATDEQKVLNAGKINFLRLHDTKWGTNSVRQKRAIAGSHGL
jgi:hypothetical protein